MRSDPLGGTIATGEATTMIWAPRRPPWAAVRALVRAPRLPGPSLGRIDRILVAATDHPDEDDRDPKKGYREKHHLIRSPAFGWHRHCQV